MDYIFCKARWHQNRCTVIDEATSTYNAAKAQAGKMIKFTAGLANIIKDGKQISKI
jgi:hypothetical protein